MVEAVAVVLLQCQNRYVWPISSTNTLRKPPPVFNVGRHFFQLLLVWKTNLFNKVLAASQNSRTHRHTVVLLTPKSWPVLLYSALVTSFHSAMATLFFRGTHSRKFVFVLSYFSIAGCSLLQRYRNVSPEAVWPSDKQFWAYWHFLHWNEPNCTEKVVLSIKV